jgi:hypothetical protein
MNMPLVLLNRRRRGAFSPAALFALAEPGTWYDPSDLTTLFQDSAGTTPVTAPNQTVGLMLDKSKALVLGSELVTNGTFASGTTGWQDISGAWSVTGGALQGTSVVANAYGPYSDGTSVVAGLFYFATFTLTVTSGGLLTRVGNDQSSAYTASGTYTRIFQAVTTGVTVFQVRATGAGFTGTIDNISVKLLAGNHATQATSGQRPTYGVNPITGTRNRLTYTEQFDNAVWTLDNSGATNPVVTANFGAAPDGTNTADRIQLNKTGGTFSRINQILGTLPSAFYTFSVWLRNNASGIANVGIRVNNDGVNCAVTTSWQRFSVTLSAAGVAAPAQILLFDSIVGNDETADILAWGAQVETGSTATAYQKVVSQYEVTEDGVASASYLAFDGVDDGMVTGTITPAIDKVQVFAGVRKLSDAAIGSVAEFSANVNTNNGSMWLAAPVTNGGTNYYFTSKGTVASAGSVASPLAAPLTSVLTGIGDISADVSTLRVNSSQVFTSATDQGTGNYLSYPLYLGRRGGASVPYNGRIYSLIVRFGTNLTTGQITATESWVNSKTGGF